MKSCERVVAGGHALLVVEVVIDFDHDVLLAVALTG
jgi:hypothetical protein